MAIYVEVGLDTAPGDSPRSYEYNHEGMDFEGWEQKGGPFFGITWFRKEVNTDEEAKKLKAESLAICKGLYSEHAIRGAKVGITREIPSENCPLSGDIKGKCWICHFSNTCKESVV